MFSLPILLGSLTITSAYLAGCGPYILRNSTPFDTLKYSRQPEDGEYQHGTYVNLLCSSGPVVEGKDETACNNGEWLEPLGRCPHMCRVAVLWLKWHFRPDKVTPGQTKNELQAHLAQRVGKCYNSYSGKTDSITFTCRDGFWDPSVVCPQ
ncbi:unnamed protein product [Heligmosomoides polygyrus]|uniref:Sushi domain-containing protein n=1 Tax=Heligmosomoides polygyrus TaxID=6339 RepID=A0A3P8AAL7_HELPZ|nr:unnamed protein product [Heligmosomoides polygyrus]